MTHTHSFTQTNRDKRHHGSLLLAFISLVLLVWQTNTQAKASELQENSAGELILENTAGQKTHSLLLDTDIHVDVNGLIATITMTQRFRNNSDDWVNGRYVFPLPENGAVDGMVMKIGDRVIQGVIKEKQAAKQIFTEAKKAGKKASLLEQHRSNLFSMAVANIPPQSEVTAEIRLIDRVHYDQQGFSLRLPTTLTPRYIPGTPLKLNLEEKQDVQINQQSGWGVATDIVPDAADITPPQTHAENTQTPNDFALQLNLNAGIQLAKISSPTHKLDIKHTGDQQTQVSLKNTRELMDRDLVLEWLPIKTQAPTAALFQQTIDNEHYSMAMLLPPTTNIQNALPRDITFIIDSSGSMSGDSMRKAKNSLIHALEKLNQNDRFNVIDFDSQYTPFFSTPVKANQYNIAQAKNRVSRLQANGGTQMYGPLEFALNSPSHAQRLKQVIFITDGSVGNEQQLFGLIHNKLGDARLFTVGIGSAPNSHFMSKAAQFGRGSFTYIDTNNDSSAKMDALFNKINRPIARDIVVTYKDKPANTIEQYPAKIPDLYAGEPLIVLSKSTQKIDQIDISGNVLGNAWQRTLFSAATPKNTDNIDALWARKKVAHLMDQLYTGSPETAAIEAQVVELGIKHHLLTRFTSFVAVEETPSKPAEAIAKNKAVPNLMPKGSTMAAPQTATPAGLLSFFGSLMMFFAMLIGHQGFRQTLTKCFIGSKAHCQEDNDEYQI